MFLVFLSLLEIVILDFRDYFSFGIIYKFKPNQAKINQPLLYMQQQNNLSQIAFIKHQKIKTLTSFL